jgi:hypothetical protein
LNTLTAAGAGGSQLLRGAALAAHTLQATGSLFSAIVVLSGTASDQSRDGPDETLGPIAASGAVLHVIANRAGGGEGRAEGTLRTLVVQTKGEFTAIYSSASYEAALDRLADRLSSEMLIEYVVPPGSKPIDAKVGVRLPGARVRGLGVAPK